MDPATQQQIYGGGLQAINNASPNMDPAGQLYSMVQNQHMITPSKGLADYLAPVAGAAFGVRFRIGRE